MYTIYLGASPLRHNLLNVQDLESPFLIPFKGRPLVDELTKIHSAAKSIYVLNKQQSKTLSYLRTKQDAESNLIVLENETDGPGASLSLALKSMPNSQDRVCVQFGDILLEEFPMDLNLNEVIALYSDSNNAFRYTSFNLDKAHTIFQYAPKEYRNVIKNEVNIDVGVYFFPNLKLLKDSTNNRKVTAMSDILEYFENVQAVRVEKWTDFGHLDSLIANQQLGSSRSFNSTEVQPDGLSIRKKSTNKEKIQAEAQYLNQIPENLKFYFPRVSNIYEDSYDVERWPYRSLAEYHVYWGLSNQSWTLIYNSICELISQFMKVDISDSELNIKKVTEYYEKNLTSRMSLIDWEILKNLDKENFIVNDNKVPSWNIMNKRLRQYLKKSGKRYLKSFIHGDLCFSNILVDPSLGTIKLIDPKGNFAGERSYGDLRYDFAKLRHSYSGNYDAIVAGLFQIKMNNETDFIIKCFTETTILKRDFDNFIVTKYGEEFFNDVKVLEGYLFLTMIPLHAESKERQLAFFITGMNILSELLTKE